ncbi:MAG: methylglyoxal synthase [Spirochaetota bacterium]|nr:methylglyoxal synthase [Spirochaetota bacterium]
MKRKVALVAHDAKKLDMVEWARFNYGTLKDQCELWGTNTTGNLVKDEVGLEVNLLLSGPKGGDSQLGAMICEKRVDIVVFFWDPLSVQPHDVDVKALLRLAVLYDVPIACNRSTADYLISSPLFEETKTPQVPQIA